MGVAKTQEYCRHPGCGAKTLHSTYYKIPGFIIRKVLCPEHLEEFKRGKVMQAV